MLLDEKVEVGLSPLNIKRYRSLGYTIPTKIDNRGRTVFDNSRKLTVNVDDLYENSTAIVNVKCDYCNRDITKTYLKYLKGKAGIVDKDCCDDCTPIKRQEVFDKKYGVDNPMAIKEVVNKIASKQRISGQVVEEAFSKCGYAMMSEYINIKTPIDFICQKHNTEGIQRTTYRVVRDFQSGCKFCRYEKISKENNYRWKGGISDLNNYLRSTIEDWRFDSFDYYDNRCFITGSSSNTVLHHVKNFSDIVEETMSSLKLDVRERISMYDNKELRSIEDMCNDLHYFYGYGTPIREDLHRKYHSIYKNKNNTFEQLIEFKEKYLSGELEDELLTS